MSSLVIHVTDRRTFKECRRRYRYQCVDRITSREEKADALWFGSASHHAMARLGEKQMHTKYLPLSKAIEIAQVGWYEFRQNTRSEPDTDVEYLATEMLKRYQERYFEEDQDKKVLAVEVPIELEFKELGVTLVATIDQIVEWRNHKWGKDFKNLKNLTDPKVLEMDDQMTAYMWVLRKAGYNVRGMIYDQLRKKLPSEPDLLQPDKSGRVKLSRRADLDTTYNTYLSCIKRYGLDKEDYVEYLETLKDKPDTFFRREIVTRNERELNLFELNLMAELRDMTSPDLVYYPSPGERCKYCPFQLICKCENEGGDTGLLKETYFREKDDEER